MIIELGTMRNKERKKRYRIKVKGTKNKSLPNDVPVYKNYILSGIPSQKKQVTSELITSLAVKINTVIF